jgi:hypothetical protein
VLRSPLAVRVANSNFDRHVTSQLDDIEFSTAGIGGFDSCSFELNKPIFDNPEELAVESRIVVYDTRNGRTIWEGKLTDPGRSYGDEGHRWSMTAMGPKKHASDRFSPYIAIDTNLEAWKQSFSSVAEASVTVSGLPGNDSVDCLLSLFPAGIAVANGDTINARYTLIAEAGQNIGSFRYTHTEGFIPSPASAWQILGGTANGGDTITNTQSYDTSTRTIGAQFAGPDFNTSQKWIFTRNKRNDIATNVAGDKVYTAITAYYVIALMKDRTGANITGASSYPVGYLTADLIITDLLATFCPLFDVLNATIDATTYQIDQFAYPTGARPADMFDDLLLAHPDKRWAAWETNPATGKYRFEFTGWGAQPRYEVTISDGIDLPGSSTDLYNRVTVQGLDARGRTKSHVVTSTVAALGTLTREAEPIDLGAELYTTANADRVGTQFLAANNTPPASGTLTIRRPIRDLLAGRIVQPHEIRAGSLMRVRGLSPTASGVTATDRDGATVFRLANTSFRDSDQAAVCTLDSRSYTIDQLLARLARRRQRH